MACVAPATGRAFLSDTLNYVDCQAQTIGSSGYQALAAVGSPVSMALTSLLTLFIALIGLRMLLGQSLEIRDGVWAMVRIGVVLVLATSWPAVQTVLYDLVFQGPADIAGTITGSSSLVGNGLTERLQNLDNAMVSLANAGTGRNDLSPVGGNAPPATIADELAYGLGRSAFLSSTIGATALVRLGAGILLALTPVFAGLLLFDATRGVFAGWLRGLAAAALGSLALALVLRIELALLEPWLAGALGRRTAGLATLAAPVELFVLTLGFAVALFGLLALIARVAFTLSIVVPQFPGSISQTREARFREQSALPSPAGALPPNVNSRALLVADAVATVQRREQTHAVSGARSFGGSTLRAGEMHGVSARSTIDGGADRRVRTRVSRSAQKRDTRS